MSLNLTKTQALFKKANQFIPYGVNSNFRYWGPEETLVITKGEGSYIWDADGNRYIDYRLAFGPIILGHGYPAVVERVNEAIKEGTLFAWTTPWEIKVAERIVRMCNVDKVRLTNTGTEATMHALRIARAYTNREKFINSRDHVIALFEWTAAGGTGAHRDDIFRFRHLIVKADNLGHHFLGDRT